jgi:ABC-type dipeptide/oligopeptide/nickel transport system ATPase component
MALLSVRNLAVEFDNGLELVHAVRDVSLELHKGEALGLVGESGCGKTVTAYSILKLVKSPGRIVRGEVHYAGRDLLQIPDAELRRVRGGKIAMIFQEPMTSLNPVFKIGSQISETGVCTAIARRDDAKKTLAGAARHGRHSRPGAAFQFISA